MGTVLLVCCIFSEQPSMGAVLLVCCIFSEHIFLRTPLEGFFCRFEPSQTSCLLNPLTQNVDRGMVLKSCSRFHIQSVTISIVYIDTNINRKRSKKKLPEIKEEKQWIRHCEKSVQIWSYFWSVFSCISCTPYLSVFSPNTGKYGPEITPYFDFFHAVNSP